MRTTLASLAIALAALLPALEAHAHGIPGGQARIVAASAADLVDAPAARPAWCGDERATDDARHQAPAAAHRLRALYLVPADAPSRLATVAPEIQAGADGASRLLERTRGRALRFDRGTRCGPRHIDITTIRLRSTTAQLEAAAASGTTFTRIGRELIGLGVPLVPDDELYEPETSGTLNHVAWLDGPAPSGTCGQATVVSDPTRTAQNASALGGKLALIFRASETGRFCGPGHVLHEVLHLLGAVQHEAPHATGDGHCADDAGDLMCATAEPAAADGPRIDAAGDDYWDPAAGAPLRWWTVNLSPFLCARPGCAGDRAARKAKPRARKAAARRAARRPANH